MNIIPPILYEILLYLLIRIFVYTSTSDRVSCTLFYVYIILLCIRLSLSIQPLLSHSIVQDRLYMYVTLCTVAIDNYCGQQIKELRKCFYKKHDKCKASIIWKN
jgi:hypothetical protein